MSDEENNFWVSKEITLCKPVTSKNVWWQIFRNFSINLPQDSLLDVFESFNDLIMFLLRHITASKISSKTEVHNTMFSSKKKFLEKKKHGLNINLVF